MASIGTQELTLPADLAQGIVQQVQSGSAVAALSNQHPMLFGNTNIVTFNTTPRAEFVEEAGEKGPADAKFGVVQAVPHKVQVTVRFDQETEWADDDYKLGVLQTVAQSGATALARALDLGVFHRLNPSTGTVISGWTNYLTATTKQVTGTDNPDADIEKAIGLVLTDGEGYDVNGLALDKQEAFALATVRDKQGRPLYPELGYGTSMTSFKGIRTQVTSTVDAPEAQASAKPTSAAIVGDFANGIFWGIQRQLPVTRIDYGDPDGLGDLQRHNQFALRLEILYAWYVFQNRFAVVNRATAAGASK